MSILNEIKEKEKQINILREELEELNNKYLNELIILSGFTVGEQVIAVTGFKKETETLCWITGFKVDYKDKLSVLLKKVKKDGTNGNAIFNSWGFDIKNIKKTKEN